MATEQYPKFYLYKRIVQAKLYIDNNYSENIDLEKISDESYFSKFHFIRLFKQIYGKTPHQYLTFVRLEKAKELMCNGQSVSDVCYSVGFESLGSFSTKFKSTIGESPTAFISRQQSIRTEMAANPRKFVPGCMAGKLLS